jgi:hypothetical protein
MDDRAGMVEALHERVLAVLGETREDETDQLARAANDSVVSSHNGAAVRVDEPPSPRADEPGQLRLL